MTWKPDILGKAFDDTLVNRGRDYSGDVRCAVVRRLAPEAKRAVVYVHGFSDYFFQKDMAEEFVGHGYSFYAVDLRKYGRALLSGQRMFEVRDMREYFPDIQAAIDIAKADGYGELILIGHSTGGLSTSYYMETEPDPAVKALILNSPFLAWNLPALMRKAIVPAVSFIGRFLPNIPVKSGGTIDYTRSLSRRLGGEWDFDSRWKPDIMPDVDAGWIHAIDSAQRALAKGKVRVPLLLLHSDRSARPGDSADKFAVSDGVLDVNLIAQAGRRLGDNVTEITIPEGLHDLVLSRPAVRAQVYHAIFNWLKETRV